MKDMGRRRALKLISAAPLAVGFTFGGAEIAAAAAGAAAARKAGSAYEPQFFDDLEWRTVQVLVDLILPRDERSGSATDAGVPEFMDFLMLDPADSDRAREWRQTAMRGGLAWINALSSRRSGKSFADASEAERTAALDEIAYWKGDSDEEPPEMRFAGSLRDRQVRLQHGPAFFNSFRDLTASGFWSSPMGVEDLQYVGNSFLAEWKGPPAEVLARLGLDEE